MVEEQLNVSRFDSQCLSLEVVEAWLCATSVPKDVAWASRRDLLLCADTEEM